MVEDGSDELEPWQRLIDDNLLAPIDWYQRHKAVARRLYRTTTVGLILLAGAIPIVSLWNGPYNRVVVAIIGAVVAVISSFAAAFRWDLTWHVFSEAQSRLEALQADWELGKLAALNRVDIQERFDLLEKTTRRILANVRTVRDSEMRTFFDAKMAKRAVRSPDAN